MASSAQHTEISTDNGFKVSITDETGNTKYGFLTNNEKKSRGVDIGHQYVAVPSGKRFCLMLNNTRLVNADVRITFEGKSMGQFRVNAASQFCVKRPDTEDAAFMAHAEKSKSGKEAGVVAGKDENGLIELNVVFEKPKVVEVEVKSKKKSAGKPKSRGGRGMDMGDGEDECLESMRSGGPSYGYTQEVDGKHSFGVAEPTSASTKEKKKYTAAALALGGATGQTFNDVSAITDPDTKESRQLILRILSLIEPKKQPEKSVAIAKLMVPPPRIMDDDDA